MGAYGVGLVLNPDIARFLRERPGEVDYVAVIPETLWADSRSGADRFRSSPAATAMLDEVASTLPLVAHGIGLSIGTAADLDVPHLDQVASWQERYGFAWYGEHLSYTRVVSSTGTQRHAGLALPVPYDADVLEAVAARVAGVRERVPVPFALENPVTFTPLADEDMTEPEFLNALAARSGCHVLLDLHNLHVNAVNGVADAEAYVAALDLANVIEIHVAGGKTLSGTYTDAHSGPCPDEVWRLLDAVLPRCPNVRGVTFEIVAGHYDRLGQDTIAAEVARMRAAWERR
ncbi:MAG TPA: DUF692 family protein [Frankiaceae bacterium]|nr:DUF692 family protein [Frankiaceae bacterium]